MVKDIRDAGSIPGRGRSPGEGNSNPLQSSCLENPLDRGAWWATVHRVTKSWRRLRRQPSRHAGTHFKQNVKGNDLRAQRLSCVQLCDLMDCSLPGSSVHGILQARTLEWVAISFSRGFSQFWDRTHITCGSCLAADSLSLSHSRSPPKTTQCILIHEYLCKERHF